MSINDIQAAIHKRVTEVEKLTRMIEELNNEITLLTKCEKMVLPIFSLNSSSRREEEKVSKPKTYNRSVQHKKLNLDSKSLDTVEFKQNFFGDHFSDTEEAFDLAY